MPRLFKLIPILLLVLVALPFALPAEEDAEARKARILANLKLTFPQLEEVDVTVGEIEPSGFEGLEQGFFTMRSPRGPQRQEFLVATDDSKLFLISAPPIDVSRSAEEIAAELAKREAEEAERSAERQAELESSIVGMPARGNPEAPVLIVEFSDFQCPYCARGAETVEQILAKYPDDVKFVFKHFPLGFHPWAKPASIAAHCAGKQNQEAFWTLHDEYFDNQKQLNPENVLSKSREYLAESGIDMEAWAVCAEDQGSEEYKAAAALVDADMALGQKLGVSGTPGFFVNGEFLSGAQPLAAFEPLIAKAKSES